jgi:hypothetical protein
VNPLVSGPGISNDYFYWLRDEVFSVDNTVKEDFSALRASYYKQIRNQAIEGGQLAGNVVIAAYTLPSNVASGMVTAYDLSVKIEEKGFKSLNVFDLAVLAIHAKTGLNIVSTTGKALRFSKAELNRAVKFSKLYDESMLVVAKSEAFGSALSSKAADFSKLRNVKNLESAILQTTDGPCGIFSANYLLRESYGNISAYTKKGGELNRIAFAKNFDLHGKFGLYASDVEAYYNSVLKSMGKAENATASTLTKSIDNFESLVLNNRLILGVGNNHYLSVLSYDKTSKFARVYDPAIGIYKQDISSLLQRLSGSEGNIVRIPR